MERVFAAGVARVSPAPMWTVSAGHWLGSCSLGQDIVLNVGKRPEGCAQAALARMHLAFTCKGSDPLPAPQGLSPESYISFARWLLAGFGQWEALVEPWVRRKGEGSTQSPSLGIIVVS